MRATMQALERVFPGCAIVLLVAPFDGPKDARVNYIGNADRTELLALMKEVVARFEGRRPQAPETRQ